MSRFAMVFAFLMAGCSFIADFDPGKTNGGGSSGSGGSGGSGGTPMDAPIDGKKDRDAQVIADAAIDARVECQNNSDCDDGFACTSDYCSFNTCHHTLNNSYCSLPTQCTMDTCDPSNVAHGPDGCVHAPVICPVGQACDEQQSCIVAHCNAGNQCPPTGDCCQIPHCSNDGICSDEPLCGSGQVCINYAGTCTCQ